MEIIYRHFETLPSTNDWAKAHLSSFSREALHVISSDCQTSGRGRYGRKWISPRGSNLYATFVFFSETAEPVAITRLLALTAAALFPFECQLKWPNDLLVNGKKIAGILCETSSDAIIIGIGINVHMTAEELAQIDQPATSLQLETGRDYSVKELLHDLSGRFASELAVV